MANYAIMGVTAMIMLVFINVFVLFTLQMPGGQNGEAMNLGISTEQQFDISQNSTAFATQLPQIGAALTAYLTKLSVDVAQKNYLNLFGDALFGSIAAVVGTAGEVFGIVGILISALLNIFVGYLVWIDYLLPPAIPQLALIGMAFKGFFFFITLYGLYVIVSSMFGLGTGSRTQFG